MKSLCQGRARFIKTPRVLCLSGVFAGLLGTGLLGCVDASAPAVPVTPPNEVLSRLIATPAALVMAINDSLRPVVTAKNLLDEPLSMADGPSVVWTSSDNTIVSVDSNGWIHAYVATPGSSALLTASWKYKNVVATTLIDVNITDEGRTITALRLIPEDSTRTSNSEVYEDAYMTFARVVGLTASGDSIGLSVTPTATDSIGRPIHRAQAFQFYWGGPIGQYLLRSNYIGDYWLHVEATIYGVPLQDSVRYTGLYPHVAFIGIGRNVTDPPGVFQSEAIQQEAFVQRCAPIRFFNSTPVPVGITFDDPDKTGVCKPGDVTGNIATIGQYEEVTRVFPAVGTIRWTLRNVTTGQLIPSATGTITVRLP